MAPVEKQFDNAARQKFMAMYPMTLEISQIVHCTTFQMHLKVDMVYATI